MGIYGDGDETAVQYIANMRDGAVAGYKYFDMGKARGLSVEVSGSYPDIHLGVAPYVVNDRWNGEKYTPTGSWAFAASSETKDIEGATKLVQWMSGIESGVRIWEMAKSFPSTYEAFEQIEAFSKDENYSALYSQLSKYGHPRPKTPVYPQVSASFQEVLESTALGGKDIQSEMDKSVERINAKLARYVREE